MERALRTTSKLNARSSTISTRLVGGARGDHVERCCNGGCQHCHHRVGPWQLIPSAGSSSYSMRLVVANAHRLETWHSRFLFFLYEVATWVLSNSYALRRML